MIRSLPYIAMALGVAALAIIGTSMSTEDAVAALAFETGPRYMQIIVSFVVLVAALYVLIFRKDDSKWAAAALGTILGYWLPS